MQRRPLANVQLRRAIIHLAPPCECEKEKEMQMKMATNRWSRRATAPPMQQRSRSACIIPACVRSSSVQQRRSVLLLLPLLRPPTVAERAPNRCVNEQEQWEGATLSSKQTDFGARTGTSKGRRGRDAALQQRCAALPEAGRSECCCCCPCSCCWGEGC
ncbi:unnamed protein product [Gongylonema pulchrum]|uniref:Uncharacterized protein n=1 Tax=Gongylonema pulchrum TaxID=637853 RepID=A0A183CWH9_9BILA|nr:unnamed protein product [Gongylonema pulchrum]